MGKPLILQATDPHALERACELIRSGGVIAFPTDTVYGIGGLAASGDAIREIYRIKGRSFDKPLPVMLADVDQLGSVAIHIPSSALCLARHYWPGALTIVLPKNPELPPGLTTLPTVGIRIPDHSFAIALLKRCGPLAVTSANISGQPEALEVNEVLAQLGGEIDLIVDGGRSEGGRASTVVDLSGRELHILRQGPISEASIRQVLADDASMQEH